MKINDKIHSWTVIALTDSELTLRCACGVVRVADRRLFKNRTTKSCRECAIDRARAGMSRMFYQKPLTRFQLAETGRVKAFQ